MPANQGVRDGEELRGGGCGDFGVVPSLTPMPTFHQFLGGSIVGIFFVIFCWGTLYWIKNRDPGRYFWGLLGVGQAILGLQAVVGIILFLTTSARTKAAQLTPPEWLHYSYGGFAILVLIVAHRIAKRYEGVEWAVFAIASLFVTGLLIRGYMTGTGMP